jgi:DNA-binding CsgD family transcriptional regulator
MREVLKRAVHQCIATIDDLPKRRKRVGTIKMIQIQGCIDKLDILPDLVAERARTEHLRAIARKTQRKKRSKERGFIAYDDKKAILERNLRIKNIRRVRQIHIDNSGDKKPPLTEQEREDLVWLLCGARFSVRKVADIFQLSPETIHGYAKRCKLNFKKIHNRYKKRWVKDEGE